MTVILGALQSIGIAAILTKQGLVLHPGIGFILMTVLTLTTGTAFIMWLGEQITDRGIGNGMSLLIFAGIVAGLPRGVGDLVQKVQTDAWGSLTFLVVLLLVAGMVGRGGLHRVCRAQSSGAFPSRARGASSAGA